MSESDDIALIARVVASDDRDAFGELVRRHQSAVRAFLRQLTQGDHARADDLAQDTFIAAYRTLGRFRGDSAFSTWLLGIAHNLFRNDRRQQRDIPCEAIPDTADNEPTPIDQAALRHDLSTALRRLSTDEQTVLHVCYQQGLSHREASSVLGWPVGTVKTHLLRGKEKLRTLLSAWNPNS